MIKSDEQKVEELLSRGVSEFVDPGGVFKARLIKKIKGEYKNDIIIKLGVDPTRPDIHLGHTVLLHKMRTLQDLGCKVIFLVGDFTAQIGDPTGKDKTRPEVLQGEVEKNMATYLEQIKKILRTEKNVFSWIRNSDWFLSPFDLTLPKDYKVSLSVTQGSSNIDIPINPQSVEGRAVAFKESRMQNTALKKANIENVSTVNLLWTLKHITHSKLIGRDMFQERIKKGEELYLHEMLYPVFQGIDSHVLAKLYGSCDLEIGGTDQTFNMLLGRDVMKINKQEQQAVLSVNILRGTDGKEKMSKSLDNYIAITDTPENMYGKIMSLPDELIVEYFELATFVPEDDIKKIKETLRIKKENPRDIKMRLAKNIVSMYYGEQRATQAEKEFVSVFQKQRTPENIEEIHVTQGTLLEDIVPKLKEKGLIKSRAELTRLLMGGGIKMSNINEEMGDLPKLTTIKAPFDRDVTIKIGKTRFVKIIVR